MREQSRYATLLCFDLATFPRLRGVIRGVLDPSSGGKKWPNSGSWVSKGNVYTNLTWFYSEDCFGGLDTGKNDRSQRGACQLHFGAVTLGAVVIRGRTRPQVLSVASPRSTAMKKIVRSLWSNQDGQDIAEYAVMLAVILVIVVGTIRLVGSNANNTFSSVASAIQ